jgi:hypothetical protein
MQELLSKEALRKSAPIDPKALHQKTEHSAHRQTTAD